MTDRSDRWIQSDRWGALANDTDMEQDYPTEDAPFDKNGPTAIVHQSSRGGLSTGRGRGRMSTPTHKQGYTPQRATEIERGQPVTHGREVGSHGGGHRHGARNTREESSLLLGSQTNLGPNPEKALQLYSSVYCGEEQGKETKSPHQDHKQFSDSPEVERVNRNHQALVLCVSSNLSRTRENEPRELDAMEEKEPPDPGEEQFSGLERMDEEEPPDPEEAMDLENAKVHRDEGNGSKRSSRHETHAHKKGRIADADIPHPNSQVIS
ncbi:hypothetical protein J5N97_002588 [Dioscorea zingiberensis]|uniref:Uncharacterized protein n=1 Tax=Dioscorea zingiberensis TaxID=325984 RepID=A0A9D5D4E0_9LILI|nr:hypothetical protein J5N97_002588 [Dioscorea zingiberensis]